MGLTRAIRWAWWPLAVLAIAAALALLPGRTLIPPNIQSDYVYLLLAADRFVEGHGLASLQPIAPFEPWSWQYDWGWLTQWPPGYPILVASVRGLTGGTTVEACRWISVLACAMSLVGWFAWVRRCVPRCATGWLLAAAAAGTSVSAASLIDPSTDVLLVALLPYVLFAALRAVEAGAPRADGPPRQSRPIAWFVVGRLGAGALFWIRYASVFVPLAIGVYLAALWFTRRGIRLFHLVVFSAATLVPIATLLLLHRMLSPDSNAQQQLNLGQSAGLDFTWALLGETWWTYTGFGFYNYHKLSHWFFACWPVLPIVAALMIPRSRRRLGRFLAMPSIGLSALVVVCLLGLLIAATAVFGGKYHYTTLERYYAAARPLYFVLFVAPVLLVPWRLVRAGAAAVLLIACSWTIQQEWPRPYRRWLAASRPTTHYGRWARFFEPGAVELFGWLSEQDTDDVIVLSNFHEYIALETGIPTLPLPPDEAALRRWIGDVAARRGIDEPRVLFVLAPDNFERSYFLPPPVDVVDRYGLRRLTDIPPGISAWVCTYDPTSAHARSGTHATAGP